MTQTFPSSFIPKGSITDIQPQKKKISILGFLSFLIFILSIVGSVGMYFYKNNLKNKVAELDSQLVIAGQSIDKEAIKEMTDFSKKIKAIRSIVDRHSVVSGFIKSLASSTVNSVYFTDFSYEDLKNGSLGVNLKGSADSYGSVALQESVFTKNKYWRSVNFSNLRLGADGSINFDVSIVVDPEISIYNPIVVSVATTTASAPAVDDLEGVDMSGLDLEDTDFNF